MGKIVDTPLEKTIFFIANFIIISFQREVRGYFVLLLWLLLCLLIQKGNVQKKFLVYIPALIFIIPPLLIQGVSIKDGKFFLNIDYFIFMRVMVTLTASTIYVSSMTFKEFCNLMNYIKLPNFIIEIIIYMHKFITIMFRNYSEYKVSYKNRAGKFNMKGVANLAVIIFKRLYIDLKNMENALYIRGYKDSYPFSKSVFTFNITKFCLMVVYVIGTIKILERY